ncbi:MAG TPA: bifunctional lysylphosphatidylglycerol flippase/synthetase MprF [Gemmatimonadales bacterium]|nr:bifunctional lysylphosphatidylglycerol flippase/synthetase MprF [Gemmatimonadales bacterium]
MVHIIPRNGRFALSTARQPPVLHTARRLLPVAAIATAGLALWSLRHLLRESSWPALRASLRSLEPSQVLVALVATLGSYLMLAGYDVLAIRGIGRRLSTWRVAGVGAVAYAITNTLGLTLLTGSSIRLRLWTGWGLSATEIASAFLLGGITFWSGAALAGGTTALVDPSLFRAATSLPFPIIRVLGLLIVLLPLLYLAASMMGWTLPGTRRWRIALPSVRVVAAQLFVGTLDWLLAALVLWSLLPTGRPAFLAFLGIFVAAQVVGAMSHVPGGAGVFEAGIVLLLGREVAATPLLGALIAYRAIYYLVPFLLGLVALIGWEIRHRRERIGQFGRPLLRTVGALAPTLLAGVTMLAGLILLFSGATPADPGRLRALHHLLPLGAIESAHLAGSVIGTSLLLLGAGLLRRLDGAWLLSVSLLALGIVASLFKGFDWEEAGLLSLVLIALLPARGHFYRQSRLLGGEISASWLGAVALVLVATTILVEFAFRHVAYRGDLWWQFGLHREASRALRALVASAGLLGVVAMRWLLGSRRSLPPPVGDAARDTRISAILATAESTQGFLALTGDKTVLFDPADRGFLAYGTSGGSWIAMGEPVGDPATRRELAWRFKEEADRVGARTVFYQVGTTDMGLYVDLGLTLAKLGEQATVELETFTLGVPARHNVRRSHRQARERDGCTLEILDAGATRESLELLRPISDAWLASRGGREKGFSLGRFDAAYLAHTPIAVVRQAERPLAFANLWLAGDRSEVSIDLMRHAPDAPNTTMDFLFVELMLWGQAAGYRRFDLGMAPLSGLPEHRLAPLWSRVGQSVFEHGEHFYGFQGLRRYKAKFNPAWSPRYLASPSALTVPLVLRDIAALINRPAVRAADSTGETP